MAKGNFNPYEVLGITKDATEKDVQKAYKLQCLKWHPDKNRGNEEEAQRKFILAKEAFELLYDKERRADHDKGVEATRVRDERQRERMEKSDEKRRKLMEELRAREKQFAQEERKPDELTPGQQAAKRKRDEKRVKSDFEDLARRLFKEAEEEMKAKNEQLNKSLAEHQKQKAASANTGKLRVKWPSEIILSDIALRKKFASYGTLVAISPIVDTKKKQKLCILEFESITDAGLKLDLSKDDKRLFKIDWKELPPRGGAKPAATPDVIVLDNKPPQSSQNFEQMSFAELMSHIDSKVNAPPPEKKSRP